MHQAQNAEVSANGSIATCGVCFNILQDPVTLECGDSFCMPCIRSHLERHQNLQEISSGFLCFLCLQPNRSVNINTIAEFRNGELAARVRELSHGKEDAVVCDWCEEAQAMQYCAACGYGLCTECNVAVHKNSLKRNHSTVAITDGRRPVHQFRKCPQRGHEDHKAEFFCVKCQTPCCVYCLQIGVHKGHESITLMDAAADVRHQLSRQVDEVVQIKSRLDNIVQELNRVTQMYEESYDIVEQQLSDRFALYQQQILKKEAEAREALQQLRLNGDRTIADCRRETLQNVNRVNEAILRGRRLQAVGSDIDVLDNRTTLNVFHRMEVPVLAGTGFRFADPGDLNLNGLNLAMDLRAMLPANAVGSSAIAGSHHPGLVTSTSATHGLHPQQQQAIGNMVYPSTGGPQLGRRKQSLTFPQDSEIDARTLPDGLSFRCIETAASLQVGIRSIEHFVDGINTWKVRLDRFPDGAVGIMCAGGTSDVALGEGFFWRPGRQTFEGRLGSPTDLILKHPATRPGDILKFTFDADRRQLRVAHNGVERGPLLTNVQGYVSPCFMFNPGECITLLQ